MWLLSVLSASISKCCSFVSVYVCLCSGDVVVFAAFVFATDNCEKELQTRAILDFRKMQLANQTKIVSHTINHREKVFFCLLFISFHSLRFAIRSNYHPKWITKTWTRCAIREKEKRHTQKLYALDVFCVCVSVCGSNQVSIGPSMCVCARLYLIGWQNLL